MRKVTDVPKYTQAELCIVVGLDPTTANNWVLRKIIRPGKIQGRDITRVRLFSELEVYRAKFVFELANSLRVAPSKAAEIRSTQAAHWVRTADRFGGHESEKIYALLEGQAEGWKSTICRRLPNSASLLGVTDDEPAALPEASFIALSISRLISEVRFYNKILGAR